jgi:hypothetical protein
MAKTILILTLLAAHMMISRLFAHTSFVYLSPKECVTIGESDADNLRESEILKPGKMLEKGGLSQPSNERYV